MNRHTLITIAALFFVSISWAQNSGGSFRDQFNRSRQQYQNAFTSYSDSINTVFAEYLAKSWEQFEVEKPIDRPVAPPPKTMPVYVPDDSPDKDTVRNEAVDTSSVSESLPAPRKNDMLTVEPAPSGVSPSSSAIDFFGSSISLNPLRSYDAKLVGTDERYVAAYWSQLSKTNYSSFIEDLNRKRSGLELGAWGFYRLLVEWTEKNFSRQQENEKAIFIVYMMNQAGYKAKIGRVKTFLVVMTAFKNAVYGKPYIKINGENYYILSDRKTSGLPVASYKLDYARAISSVDLKTRTPPKFEENAYSVARTYRNKEYALKCNRNFISYYQTFPQTELSVYAAAPFSAIATESIDKELGDDLKGKTAIEKIKFLLAFIQFGFEYETDDDQFGVEKFFFAEEVFFHPHSDCEDRAVLFCRLVKHFCNLDTLLVEYPSHVASAVRIDHPGDAIVYNGDRYIVCDPTYIGAPIAKTMQGCDNATANIIAVY